MTIKRNIALFLLRKVLDELNVVEDGIHSRSFVSYTFEELVEYSRLVQEFQAKHTQVKNLNELSYNQYDEIIFNEGEAYRELEEYHNNYCITEPLW